MIIAENMKWQLNIVVVTAAIILLGCAHVPPAQVIERSSPAQLTADDQQEVCRLLGVSQEKIRSMDEEAPDTIVVYCYGSDGMDWAGPMFRVRRTDTGWAILGRGRWDGHGAMLASPGLESQFDSPFPMELPRPKF